MTQRHPKDRNNSEISISFATTVKIKNLEGVLIKAALAVSKLALMLIEHANAICALISLINH